MTWKEHKDKITYLMPEKIEANICIAFNHMSQEEQLEYLKEHSLMDKDIMVYPCNRPECPVKKEDYNKLGGIGNAQEVEDDEDIVFLKETMKKVKEKADKEFDEMYPEFKQRREERRRKWEAEKNKVNDENTST